MRGHICYRQRIEEAMRLEHELQEAEEIARKEAEAEAAALTEILNLDNALQVLYRPHIMTRLAQLCSQTKITYFFKIYLYIITYGLFILTNYNFHHLCRI